MARRSQQPSDARRRGQRRDRSRVRERGIASVLTRAVRDVERGVQQGRVTPALRAKVQAIALLMRQARADIKSDQSMSNNRRAGQLERIEEVAANLARAAAREASLLELLAEDAVVSDEARVVKREMVRDAGLEAEFDDVASTEVVPSEPATQRRVVPQSVVSRKLANPFLTPDFSAVGQSRSGPRRLESWELLGPLFRSFESASDGAPACMTLPEPASVQVPGELELMPHQASLIASVASGHRTFLLADEPGLGKTAQALLAAQAADAYPLLVVVPNVVKTNWVHEAGMWTPKRSATAIHGDGETIDGFADIVVINYEVLDRHVGWLGDLGFRGMVVDEAHFIKNKSSQRSQHVLELSDRIRSRVVRPLLMALTGTPLINDIGDFKAIWQFLGWIDDKKPLAALMDSLEDTGLTPADRGFYRAARSSVIDLGIVRRRKVEVAADIPSRRIADMPVELSEEAGRSIRETERRLARRLLSRYEKALEAREPGVVIDGIDHDLVRLVAKRERDYEAASDSEDNVFAMMRRIGQAKADPAADYAAQLARSVGKVVLFAKHVDVMDRAEALLTQRGIRHVSIRGDQTTKARQQNVEAFSEDPDVAVVVCSLTAAGVGLNLQAASNVVLAELSWTDAEQTQAIDRVHRIGQTEPVTAWRIIAARTLDGQIAELIDGKAGLASRALDGSAHEGSAAVDMQLEALIGLLTETLSSSH
ncbi:DEAD/DEAH box helicase [Solicola gregarius]|uniref:DEAD/DEAH box helicase n=1 Tax=Solicola gregarius TaxID=2908642 RepID=A0AA46YNI1_9ACTN|nr:DEAD/DEAH box helicase [Solicola gregarius]UYM07649.1 DEAD/DEAH box helicase [Solicola gregarius]